ncbi:serine/threonine-protein kinase [Yoonia litorea]|uniref:non-specific serine/threonine protein kinase n=1 Tax=Yoonia litorea TaxID=1123755 RepID=A0A1I6N2V0_9RHOB|nr:serine/threonine-protein kinase [Yoonia litorea]SFS22217.1 Serine/threonine protein kinase [Yoonia litorea]
MAKAQPKDTVEEKETFVDELKPGTKLMHGQYTIESFLNAGGFGITYLARDSLDRKVVIKECFPGAFCRRSRAIVQARSRAHQNELKSIVRLFVQEARSLAKLDHPNIVGVHQVFEDNDTAYMALDFVRGRDLLDIIEDPNTSLSPAQTKNILKEVLNAVGFIHDQQILHRDISPDNILINKDYHPVLIDFGAAREEATKQSRVLSALRVVKDGYSPQEFYIAGSDQSPSSDLYALAASFHHLIVGDVPPNSQARLAAIASGEADPYQPIAGRFPDYDDNFLAAIDKALAVLPKDRVQSAKEWLNMMDGLASNVTPLNVPNAASEKAAPAAAKASGGSSKMPVLLGSAAAVALLVGVGVMTMTGGDDAAVEAPAPVAETVAEAPAAVVETPAPVVEAPAPAEVVEAPSVPVEPAATEETVVAQDDAPVSAPSVTEETPVATDLAPVAAGAAPAEQPEVTAALEEALASQQEAAAPEAPAAVATPAITEDPALLGTSNDTSVVVAGPVINDVAIPAVRPEVRPETIQLDVPAPAPLPEPEITPELASEAPVADSLPQLAANAPSQDTEVGDVALPGAPDQIAAIGNGPEVDILAVTPGNEIIEEPEVVETALAAADALATSWTVRLPFTPAGDSSNIVAQAAPISPIWVQPGLVITAVNGNSVATINEIPDVLRATTPESALAPTMPVLFGTADPSTGTIATLPWVLPVVQTISLGNGTSFEAAYAGSSWRTVVTELSAEQPGGLRVGDVISSYIATSEAVEGRTTLYDIFARETANGVEQYTFAVQRDGSLWVASYTYGGAE